MTTLLAALVARALVVAGGSPGVQRASSACDALRGLAGSTRPQLWLNSSGWVNATHRDAGGGASSDCCGWYGVSCTEAGVVSALNLYGNRLEGTLFDGTFGPEALPELRFFSVGYNNLSGTLPSTLALAHKLEYLDARVNFISGSLPQLPPSLVSAQ